MATQIKSLGSDLDGAGYSQFPDQRISSKAKRRKDWKHSCVDFLTQHIFSDSVIDRRKPRSVKQKYYDILHGELDADEIRRTFDPMGITYAEDEMPEHVIGYNPLKKGFRTLFNEFKKRTSHAQAIAINPEVINQKDIEFMEKVASTLEKFQQQAQEQGSIDTVTFRETLEELDYWSKHDLQSAHEVMSNQIINYFVKNPRKRYRHTTGKGFMDLSVVGEVIYKVYGIGEEPHIAKVNTNNFIVLGMGSSDFIEDGWAWIEWDYVPVHKINEEFELTDNEYEALLQGSEGYLSNENLYRMSSPEMSIGQKKRASNSTDFTVTSSGQNSNSPVAVGDEYVNAEGDVLVSRGQWVSQRPILEVVALDEEGNEITTLKDENYVVNTEAGETAKKIWVDEIWEFVKIGENIYKEVQVCPVQMRSISNPKEVRPSYVGAILTYGDENEAASAMDDLISFKRDYDLYANKLKDLWARHLGSVTRIDKSRLDSNMTLREHIVQIKSLGLLVEDSFNTSVEGQMVGNNQNPAPVIQPAIIDESTALLNKLSFIQNQIDNYLSMPASRTGELTGREGLGVVQQDVISATLSTEDLFILHEQVQAALFEVTIEYCKHLWSGSSVKKQYLMDDMSQSLLDVDGDTLSEAEYGVVISDSSKLRDLQRQLDMFGQAMIQNGVPAPDVMSAYLSESPTAMQKRLEQAQDKAQKRQAELEQQKIDAQKEMQQAQMAMEERKHAMELEKIRLKGEMEIAREKAKAALNYAVGKSMDENGDGVEDDVEIKTETIKADAALEVARIKAESERQKQLDNKMLKEKELELKRKEIESRNNNK